MEDYSKRWADLLNEGRRKKRSQPSPEADEQTVCSEESRTEIERDYDRILFSTPVRRLADKTQVFPLDKNDSVRTRLTHSHEVSNIARSIGTALVFKHQVAQGVPDATRNLPALLATIGLAHDLGNPPFGHQGEAAIQSWFAQHQACVLGELKDEQQKQDFLRFEGNAQAYRLITRLQLINDDYGLDLTYASLTAIMKYPVASNRISDTHVARKKHGFFAAEQHIVEEAHRNTGLEMGRRHPLAYIMEACDDIAYVVLDAEDAVKKGLASFSDLMSYIEHSCDQDPLASKVVTDSLLKHTEHQNEALCLSPSELNDVSMQRFRVYAIGAMVKAVTTTILEQQAALLDGTLDKPLLKLSSAKVLSRSLKKFSFSHAYNHRSVLEVELQGYNVIRGLMDMFWAAIVDRSVHDNMSSRRKSPFTRYVYSRISENYRRVFEKPSYKDEVFSPRYRECLLLTDMISGMTDTFAVNLFNELKQLQGEFCLADFLN